MTRPPERPVGDRPGALLGTRLSVLAAEVSDPERFRRGRAYSKQRAVTSIEVHPGDVTGLVQGSRSQPYVVHWRTRAWAPGLPQLPGRFEVASTCSCPDGVSVCKHAVAVLLEFADDVARQPDLLDRWRGFDAALASEAVEPVRAPAPIGAGGPARRRLQAVPDYEPEPEPDPLADFFGVRGPPRPPRPEVRFAPLERPTRPLATSDLERLALDTLDEVLDTLESLYG